MTLQTAIHRELIRGLVQKQITCQVTGKVLDHRTCVVLYDRDGDPRYVMSPEGWEKLDQQKRDQLATLGFTPAQN